MFVDARLFVTKRNMQLLRWMPTYQLIVIKKLSMILIVQKLGMVYNHVLEVKNNSKM